MNKAMALIWAIEDAIMEHNQDKADALMKKFSEAYMDEHTSADECFRELVELYEHDFGAYIGRMPPKIAPGH